MNEIPNILEPKEKITYESKPQYAPYIISALFGSIIAGGLIGFFVGAFFKTTLWGIIAGLIIFVGGLTFSE